MEAFVDFEGIETILKKTKKELLEFLKSGSYDFGSSRSSYKKKYELQTNIIKSLIQEFSQKAKEKIKKYKSKYRKLKRKLKQKNGTPETQEPPNPKNLKEVIESVSRDFGTWSFNRRPKKNKKRRSAKKNRRPRFWKRKNLRK